MISNTGTRFHDWNQLKREVAFDVHSAFVTEDSKLSISS
jgi:hypothetical protein